MRNIYYRAFKKNTWALLSWFSVICTVILLLFYHNTGAEQIGYRYILDAAAPLVLLVGKGMKGKSSVLFSVLTIHSVLLQLISIYWWYIGRI